MYLALVETIKRDTVQWKKKEINENDKVTYEEGQGRKGINAINVKVV